MTFLDHLVSSLHRSIHRHPDVLKYLHSRGVTAENIEEYNVGYSTVISVADDGSEDRKRFMEETHNGRYLEGFIVFPITDALGRNVGLICRSAKEKFYKKFICDEAKFTGFFFNFGKALPHIYKTGTAFIFEGSFDCVPFANYYPNSLASLTAGISDTQYELLNYYCKKIITVFDVDSAGIEQTNRAGEKWKNIYPMKIGAYKDPGVCREQLSDIEYERFIRRTVESRMVGLS
jgi:DNA primase